MIIENWNPSFFLSNIGMHTNEIYGNRNTKTYHHTHTQTHTRNPHLCLQPRLYSTRPRLSYIRPCRRGSSTSACHILHSLSRIAIAHAKENFAPNPSLRIPSTKHAPFLQRLRSKSRPSGTLFVAEIFCMCCYSWVAGSAQGHSSAIAITPSSQTNVFRAP